MKQSQFKNQVRWVIAILTLALWQSPAWGQQLKLVPFQGRITDGSGAPLDGTFRVVFAIYDDATASGGALWSEEHPAVAISNGQINVLLGALKPLDDPNQDQNTNDAVRFDEAVTPRYLGITVGPPGSQEMVPRHQLVPSFHARRADFAEAVPPFSIGTNELQADAVTTDKILDGQIGVADLSPNVPLKGQTDGAAGLLAGEAINDRDAVCLVLIDAAYKVFKCDVSDPNKVYSFAGFALGDAALNEVVTFKVQGLLSGFSPTVLVAGSDYYLGPTPGTITTIISGAAAFAGTALGPDLLYVDSTRQGHSFSDFQLFFSDNFNRSTSANTVDNGWAVNVVPGSAGSSGLGFSFNGTQFESTMLTSNLWEATLFRPLVEIVRPSMALSISNVTQNVSNNLHVVGFALGSSSGDAHTSGVFFGLMTNTSPNGGATAGPFNKLVVRNHGAAGTELVSAANVQFVPVSGAPAPSFNLKLLRIGDNCTLKLWLSLQPETTAQTLTFNLADAGPLDGDKWGVYVRMQDMESSPFPSIRFDGFQFSNK